MACFGAGFDGVVVLVSATSMEELSHGTNLGLGPDPPRPAARTARSWSRMHGADPARPRLAPLLPSPHFSAIAASPWSPAARTTRRWGENAQHGDGAARPAPAYIGHAASTRFFLTDWAHPVRSDARHEEGWE